MDKKENFDSYDWSSALAEEHQYMLDLLAMKTTRERGICAECMGDGINLVLRPNYRGTLVDTSVACLSCDGTGRCENSEEVDDEDNIQSAA